MFAATVYIFPKPTRCHFLTIQYTFNRKSKLSHNSFPAQFIQATPHHLRETSIPSTALLLVNVADINSDLTTCSQLL